MSTFHLLQRFDPAQLFRLFVDGRLHKKYKGWVGYEAGERGSVQALLNGFAHMVDHFDLSEGLRATYLLDLHKVCMMGVQTRNLKSSPGDLRFLNAGMPFFPKTTTFANLQEILAMRAGDGTAVFNTAAFAKPAEELDAQTLFDAMQRLGKINYRNWYPNLSARQQAALEKKLGLTAFYEAKHLVQMQFARKVEIIVNRFNSTIASAQNADERLRAIALVVRELELLHPFPDGNCRTVACVLLTQLLLNHEFTPALLDNPNLDGECALDEWIAEIRKGMALYEQLLKDPGARIYDYAISDSSAADRETFADMSKDLVAKIQAHRELYLTPDRLLAYTGGQWHAGSKPCSPWLRFSGVGTYNTVGAGNIYFGLEIADWEKEGKDVRTALERVVAKGVRALVLDRAEYANGWSVPVCLVADSFAAFKACAVQVRQQLDPLTLLITGTEGKTGAKVQLHHLLNFQTRAHGVINSANTEIPVLRSLAGLGVDDVVEINEVSVGGDEAYRVERAVMVNPHLCLFTHIGPNHMDMHKTMDNLLWAKSSVVAGLREGGLCIVDTDNAHSEGLKQAIWKRRPDAAIIGYGTAAHNAGQLLSASFDSSQLGWQVSARIDGEEVNYLVPMIQQHAPLASVGVLLAVKRAGFEVQRAASDYASLRPFETMGQVTRLQKAGGEVLFYDQSRRGGISGMRSAFADIARIKVPGRVVALVGGISVLRDSDWTKEAHRQLADLINHSPITHLYTTGNHIDYVHDGLQHPPVKSSNDLEELATLLANEVQPGDLLFIIGSAYLYLGRVAERVRDMLSGRAAPSQTVVGDHPRATDFRLLKVYQAVASGVGAVKASATHGVPHTEFQRSQKAHPDHAAFRGHLLHGFFEDLNRCLPALRPMRCVNNDIAQTSWARHVVTPAFCARWFNNLDKRPGVNSKQVFGSFFDFGDPEHLLHVCAATTNLHIGLVRCTNANGQYQPLAMDERHATLLLRHYPGLQRMQAQWRDWGPKWLSLDLGRYLELGAPDVFLAVVACDSQPVFFNLIRPFVQALETPA